MDRMIRRVELPAYLQERFGCRLSADGLDEWRRRWPLALPGMTGTVDAWFRACLELRGKCPKARPLTLCVNGQPVERANSEERPCVLARARAKHQKDGFEKLDRLKRPGKDGI